MTAAIAAITAFGHSLFPAFRLPAILEREGFGIAAMPLGFVVLGLLLGGRPGPGTMLAVLLVGPILGATLAVLPIHEAMTVRLTYFAAGFIVIAAGITAVVMSEIGSGSAELVMLAIHDRGYPLAPVRTASDCNAPGALRRQPGPPG